MTWEYLYPLIKTVEYPFWWWWTWVWFALSLLIIAYVFLPYLLKKKMTIPWDVTQGWMTSKTLIQQMNTLNRQTKELSAQQRYRQYQLLLRTFILKRYWIDLKSISLNKLKLSQSWINASVFHLLEQTYYFPYNQDRGERAMMEKHGNELLFLIKSHEEKV